MRAFFLAFILFLSFNVYGLQKEIEKFFYTVVNDNKSFIFLEQLTRIGPRFIGSQGNVEAVLWAEKVFKDCGVKVWKEDFIAPRWVRGKLEVALIAPVERKLIAIELGGSSGTPKEGIEGEVVYFDSLEKLKEAPEHAISGKIVFVDFVMRRKRNGADYREGSRTRWLGPKIALEKGAIAYLMRSAGTGYDRFPHTGITAISYSDGLPAIALAPADADLLRRLKDSIPRVKIFSSSRQLAPVTAYNVLGEIEGKSREIILLGAHLDSWDVGEGAIDDGIGVATVLATACYIANYSLNRTVRFVLFNNEEFGLDGARDYFDRHKDDPHILALEADFGLGKVFKIRGEKKGLVGKVLKSIRRILKRYNVKWVEEKGRGGADISFFRDRGVQFIDITPDSTFYFDYHHTENDTFDKVQQENLQNITAFYATVVYTAATLKE